MFAFMAASATVSFTTNTKKTQVRCVQVNMQSGGPGFEFYFKAKEAKSMVIHVLKLFTCRRYTFPLLSG